MIEFKLFAAKVKETYHSGCDLICEEMEQGNDPIGDYFDQVGKIGLMVIGFLLVIVVLSVAVLSVH